MHVWVKAIPNPLVMSFFKHLKPDLGFLVRHHLADPETKECWDSVQKMLDERPVWSIDMLMHVVDGKWERSLVLAVLVGLAYKFRTGDSLAGQGSIEHPLLRL